MARGRKSRKTVPKNPEAPAGRISLFSLPPELIMLVMEQLEACIQTLMHCALVCRAWRFPAQRYLFSHMHLLDSDRCNQMNRILRTVPHLATHVNAMTISHDSSFMGLRNATRLIDSLDNVRVLTIINDHWAEEPWTPDEIDNISKLSSVEVLRLQGDGSMVVRLLEAFPNLHSFQLSQTDHGLTIRDVRMSPHNQTLSRRVALRFLSLPNLESSVNSSIVELFTGPKFDYTNLQSLKLDSRVPFGHVPKEHQAGPFLKKCGQHVQNLTFVFPSQSLPNGILPKFFLSNESMLCFPNLRKLRLMFHSLFSGLGPLSQGLSRLSSLSPLGLQSITLDIFLFLCYTWRSIFTDLEALPEWSALDDFLSKPDSLPGFAELQIRFSIDLDIEFLYYTYIGLDLENISQQKIETPTQHKLSQILESCLPKTHHSGKLRVAFRTIVFKSLSVLGQRASSWNEGRPGTDVMSYTFEV